MPYVRKGNAIYKKDTGELVGKSDKPKAYLRVLQAIEHGWSPPKKRKR